MTRTPPPPPDFPPSPSEPAPRSERLGRTEWIIIGSAVAVIAAIVTTGVVVANSDRDNSKPAVAKASTLAPASSTGSPTPEPSQETLRLGDTADISADVEFSAVALAYKDDRIKGMPEMLSAGQKWSVLMVKVCNRGAEPIQTSPLVWSLAYEDGVRVEASGMNAGDLPHPLYPMDAKVSKGDCVKGNIAFQVPKEGTPERVLYSPASLDEPVEWQIGK